MKTQCKHSVDVICVGNCIYLATVEFPNVKHPWASAKYCDFTKSGDETSIHLYQGSFDEKAFLSITELKKLPEGEWYRYVIVPGTRWELEILICPSTWIADER